MGEKIIRGIKEFKNTEKYKIDQAEDSQAVRIQWFISCLEDNHLRGPKVMREIEDFYLGL